MVTTKINLCKYQLSERTEVLNQLNIFFGRIEIGVHVENDNAKYVTTLAVDVVNETLVTSLSTKNMALQHIYVRPVLELENSYLLLDDLNVDGVRKVLSDTTGFANYDGTLIVETSTHNFQVWLRFNKAYDNDTRKAIIRYFGADTACSPYKRWGRCPCFMNVKAKHLDKTTGNYFYANVRQFSQFSKTVKNGSIYELSNSLQQSIKQVSKNTKNNAFLPQKTATINFSNATSNVKAKKDVFREQYRTSDKTESEIDFAFGLALKNQGYSDSDIAQRILSERLDWSNHSNVRDYLERTIRKIRQIQ